MQVFLLTIRGDTIYFLLQDFDFYSTLTLPAVRNQIHKFYFGFHSREAATSAQLMPQFVLYSFVADMKYEFEFLKTFSWKLFN